MDLWSLGPGRTEEELRRSLETTAEIGLRGVQPWCVDDCVLDPEREVALAQHLRLMGR